MTTPPPPGYYADDSGASRWWDGERWADAAPPAPAPAPPPAPAGAPAPAPAPAPNRRGRLVAMLVTAGVVVAAGIGVTVWAMTRSDDADAGSPKAAVQELVDALTAGDCDRVRAVSTTTYWDDEGWDCDLIATYPDRLEEMQAEFQLGEPEMSSDTTAEVPAVSTLLDDQGAPTSVSTRFEVTLVDGSWLINGEVDG